MIMFIDDHHEAHGVEPICAVLPAAPSTGYDHAQTLASGAAPVAAGHVDFGLGLLLASAPTRSR